MNPEKRKTNRASGRWCQLPPRFCIADLMKTRWFTRELQQPVMASLSQYQQGMSYDPAQTVETNVCEGNYSVKYRRIFDSYLRNGYWAWLMILLGMEGKLSKVSRVMEWRTRRISHADSDCERSLSIVITIKAIRAGPVIDLIYGCVEEYWTEIIIEKTRSREVDAHRVCSPEETERRTVTYNRIQIRYPAGDIRRKRCVVSLG